MPQLHSIANGVAGHAPSRSPALPLAKVCRFEGFASISPLDVGAFFGGHQPWQVGQADSSDCLRSPS